MKELKINVPKGYEIDKDKSTFENIVFKEISKLPSSWEDLKDVSGFSAQRSWLGGEELFKTSKQAEASIALAQLSQLRDVYRQGREPDWSNSREKKYCIAFLFDKAIEVVNYSNCNHFLSFQDEETAELFLENFRDLIEKAKPLMS